VPIKAKSYFQKYREAHPQERQNDWQRGNAASRGYDHQWQIFRIQWLTANPVCKLCGHIAVLVDHIKPIAVGGARLDPTNVRSLCRDCHDIVTANYRKTGINEPPKGASK